VEVHPSLNQIKAEWDAFLPDYSNLRSDHQRGLCDANVPYLETYFLLIKQNGKLIGITTVQEYEFTSQSFDQKLLSKQLVTCLLKDYIVNQRAHLLIFGSLFRIQNPFVFLPEFDLATLAPCLIQAYVAARKKEKSFAGIFVKDSATRLNNMHCFKMSVLKDDLVMNLEIEPNWQTLDNYQAQLSKKYRKRMQKIQTQAQKIERKNLALHDIECLSKKIHQLYASVVEKQAIRIGIVNADFFIKMKSELGEKYQIIGYFENEELIGFASYIFAGNQSYEIHYVGFEEEKNEQYGLYFNMLFDAIDVGIKNGQSVLELSRTARLAKASLGAKPVEQRSYYKMQFGMPALIFMALSYLFTEKMGEDWQTRQPFKKIIEKEVEQAKERLCYF
jgi:hypothetical protein